MITLHTYFELILAVSLFELGIFAITRKGKLFDFILKWVEKLPEKVSDPIITCVTCMASLHTLIWSFLFLYVHPMFNINFSWWLVVAIAIPCAFVNTILWQISAVLEKIWKKLNDE